MQVFQSVLLCLLDDWCSSFFFEAVFCSPNTRSLKLDSKGKPQPLHHFFLQVLINQQVHNNCPIWNIWSTFSIFPFPHFVVQWHISSFLGKIYKAVPERHILLIALLRFLLANLNDNSCSTTVHESPEITEKPWWDSMTLCTCTDDLPNVGGFQINLSLSFPAGLLGPTLRGEEGEMIVVTFRNMATGPHSIHPHGIAYGKQSEGGCLLARLQMNLTAVEKLKTPVTLQDAGCLLGSLRVLMMSLILIIAQHWPTQQTTLFVFFLNINQDRLIIKVMVLKSNRKRC